MKSGIVKKINPEFNYGTIQKYLNSKKSKFDIIFINTGNPAILSNISLYFYNSLIKIKSSLSQNGIAVFILPGENAYISDESKHIKNSVVSSLKTVFKNIEIFSLTSTIIIAGNSNFQKNFENIEKTLLLRNIPLNFYNQFNIGLRLESMKKISFSKFNDSEKNYKAYSQTITGRGIALAVSEYNNILSKKINILINWNNKNNFQTKIILILAIAGVIILFTKSNYTYTAAFFSAAAGIALELVIIFVFQISFGNLYKSIGLIISMFAFGSLIALLYSDNFLYFSAQKNFKVGYLLIITASTMAILLYNFSGIPIFYFFNTLVAGLGSGFIFAGATEIIIDKKILLNNNYELLNKIECSHITFS